MHFKRSRLNGANDLQNLSLKVRGRGTRKANLLDCLCDCGNQNSIRTSHLRSGAVTSCGCDRYRKVAEKVKVMVTPLEEESVRFTSWAQMHARCSNPEPQSVSPIWRPWHQGLRAMG